jgi:1-deoxy-D-xylulose-5-phosphate synthase
MSPGSTEPEQLFTALGLDYIGPVDGGHIESVVVALERARSSTQIPIVHVKTGPRPAVPVGHAPDGSPRTRYPDLAAAVIGSEMARDDRIVAITPSLLDASGLAPVFKRYPDRCFDPGLEEQHAMTMTLGLALEGYKPVIVIQSAFMPRAFDPLLHEVCRRNLPTLMLAVGIGFASDDDLARRGLCDCSCWRGLPNLRVMYPKDRFELERMVRTGLREMTGPTVVAMPGGPADEFDPSVLDEPPAVFDRPQVVTPGKEMTIIAVGRMFATASEVAARLRQAGVDCGLVNLRHLQPLPEEALAGILAGVPRVITLEEGVLDGGVGSAIAALVMDRRLRCEVLRRGVPTQCVAPLSRDELCRLYGLDVEGVLKAVREFWKA